MKNASSKKKKKKKKRMKKAAFFDEGLVHVCGCRVTHAVAFRQLYFNLLNGGFFVARARASC